jgi:hypothetical protein
MPALAAAVPTRFVFCDWGLYVGQIDLYLFKSPSSFSFFLGHFGFRVEIFFGEIIYLVVLGAKLPLSPFVLLRYSYGPLKLISPFCPIIPPQRHFMHVIPRSSDSATPPPEKAPHRPRKRG